MRRSTFCLSLALAVFLGREADAGLVFSTESTATLTITSQLFGGAVVITAKGTQQFSLDLATHVADVTSPFKGTDLPDPLNPGGFLSYDLYNTATTGTIVQNVAGTYDIDFKLLFELKLTSGPLSGLTFETLQLATFDSSGISTLPFPAGTAFSDPTRPDTVGIYVKADPSGLFPYPVGTLIGTTSDRVVTINSVVPEPAGVVLIASAAASLLGSALRQRRGRAVNAPPVAGH